MSNTKQALKPPNRTRTDGDAAQVLMNVPLSQQEGRVHHTGRQEGVHSSKHPAARHTHGGK